MSDAILIAEIADLRAQLADARELIRHVDRFIVPDNGPDSELPECRFFRQHPAVQAARKEAER